MPLVWHVDTRASIETGLAVMLTIVMYHYVRDLPRTRYPRLKALWTEQFDRQLDHLCTHYTVCTLRQVIAAARGEEELPPRACLLTFDDGFIDHYVTVFPRLRARGLRASFYPPARVIAAREILDVHKLHFVLAAVEAVEPLVQETLALLRPYRAEFDLADDRTLYERYAQASRLDPAPVVFVKRLLQHGLPERVRREVLGTLFARHVSDDPRAFADELYLNAAQLREMLDHGMEVGGHGDRHVWLEHLAPAEQADEIRHTVEFLEQLYGRAPTDWVMCYPFGSYNAVTLDLLARRGTALGLTTKVGVVADWSSPLELPRLDTRDLPGGGAEPKRG